MVVSDSMDDFLVSLPLANAGTDKATNPWIYDVKVFPKNTLGDAGSKSIVKEGTVLGDVRTVDNPETAETIEGDRIKWQINVPITNPSANSKYLTELQIINDLDAAFGAAAGVKDLVVKNGQTTLSKGKDYNVTPVDSNAQRLQIDFIKTVDKSEPADSAPDAIGVVVGDKVVVPAGCRMPTAAGRQTAVAVVMVVVTSMRHPRELIPFRLPIPPLTYELLAEPRPEVRSTVALIGMALVRRRKAVTA